jgi:diaminopimelate decarboxylase
MKYKYPPLHLIPDDLAFNKEKILQSIIVSHETPFYSYDFSKIKKNWNVLKKALPSDSVLCYSVKANPNKTILKGLNELDSRFEASSINEIKALLDSNISPTKIIYVAPGKSEKDIALSIKFKIKIIVVDSQSELLRIEKISSSLRVETNILFRLNTGKRSTGSLTMSGQTQFGMSIDDIVNSCHMISTNEINHCRFLGFQSYHGTNIFDVHNIVNYIDDTLEAFKKITEKTQLPPSYLDVGGGFGSPLFEGEQHLNIHKLTRALNNVIAKHFDFIKTATLIFESGRYVVGDSGILITRVNDVKHLHDKKYALLDAGINNYGGFSMRGGFRHPPIKTFPKKEGVKEEVITLCGPLCTPIDIIASDIMLPEISTGDYIIIYNAGAYQYSSSPGYFLSFGFPNEIVYNKNNDISSCSISFAHTQNTNDIIEFFNKYLGHTNSAMHSEEFFCQDGISTAIKKKNIVVSSYNDRIIGAYRFYRRKNGEISLYQFAVSDIWRGQRLIHKMLKFLGRVTIHTKCPINNNFNDYFKNTGWTMVKHSTNFNYWIISF